MNTKTQELVDGVPVHEPDGAIDITNSVDLRETMLKQVESGSKAIVLDLRAVRYVDSSGLSTLVSVATSLEKSNGKLVLCHVDAAVMKVLEMTRLTEYFDLCADRDEAVGRAQAVVDA